MKIFSENVINILKNIFLYVIIAYAVQKFADRYANMFCQVEYYEANPTVAELFSTVA